METMFFGCSLSSLIIVRPFRHMDEEGAGWLPTAVREALGRIGGRPKRKMNSWVACKNCRHFKAKCESSRPCRSCLYKKLPCSDQNTTSSVPSGDVTGSAETNAPLSAFGPQDQIVSFSGMAASEVGPCKRDGRPREFADVQRPGHTVQCSPQAQR